jgi:predicted DsbA family dithiol-disulfide isomerase
VEATCWSDYLCPWCYVGQARDRLFTELGVTVVHRPYELHPEIPAEGRRVRPDGRLSPTFDRVEEACAEAGLPFRRPERMPNTRVALETAEWVRVHHPHAFAAVHQGLFAAHFATGDPLDDQRVLDAIVAGAGAPADEVRAAVGRGDAAALVDASMAQARDAGVTSTPSWVLGDGFVIPGALDASTIRRWLEKVVARQAPTTSPSSPSSPITS